MEDERLNRIHDTCGWHEDAILRSSRCGCFYCLAIFPATEIVEWDVEAPECPRGPGRSAVCPKCGIDSVLPDSLWYDLTPELLEEMNEQFF